MDAYIVRLSEVVDNLLLLSKFALNKVYREVVRVPVV